MGYNKLIKEIQNVKIGYIFDNVFSLNLEKLISVSAIFILIRIPQKPYSNIFYDVFFVILILTATAYLIIAIIYSLIKELKKR